jgi:O-antigen ligase
MLKRFERYFAVAMLLYLSGSILGFLFPDSETNLLPPASNRILLAIQTVFYASAFVLVALRWKQFVRGLLPAKWVLAISVLAMASTAWSEDPSLTFRRSLVLLGTTLFGVYFAARFDLGEQVRILAKTFGIIVALSFCFALLLPKYGINHDIYMGSWTGVFTHKNSLGRAMIVAVAAFLCAKQLIHWSARWALFASALGLLYLSHSRTSQLVLLAMLLLMPAYRLFRSHNIKVAIPAYLAFGGILTVLAAIAAANTDILFIAIGRSSSLTGRTEVWRAVCHAISQQMFLGYGFAGFWAGIRGKSAGVIQTVGWAVKQAHNGFLDIWLDLGIVGLSLFLVSYFDAFVRALRLLRRPSGPGAYWPVQYLSFMLLYHFTEGPIVRQNSLFWALYVATVVCVHSVRSPAVEVIVEEAREGAELETQLDYLPG